MELVSQAKLAKKIGKSRQYISELKQKGIFDKCFKGKKLVLDCAIKAIESSIKDVKKTDPRQYKKLLNDEIAQTIPAEVKNSPLKGKYIEELEELLQSADNPAQTAHIIKEYWQGKLLQVKYEKERAKYILKDQVTKEFNMIVKVVTSEFNKLASVVAKQCYGKDIAEIQNIIYDGINNTLENLQNPKTWEKYEN